MHNRIPFIVGFKKYLNCDFSLKKQDRIKNYLTNLPKLSEEIRVHIRTSLICLGKILLKELFTLAQKLGVFRYDFALQVKS